MRTICNAIYLTGGHLTFRELLSLLSYAVTFAQDCEERWQSKSYNDDKFLYYNIFEKSTDVLLKKVSDMDPALGRGKYEGNIYNKKDYICYRRKNYFKNREKQYEMLHVDYLPQFCEVLNYMNCKPYHYDVSREKNETLQMLKRGINKMISRDKDDTGLTVTDTPFIFDSKIRLEFMGLQDVALIWNRYDLRIGKKIENERCKWIKDERHEDIMQMWQNIASKIRNEFGMIEMAVYCWKYSLNIAVKNTYTSEEKVENQPDDYIMNEGNYMKL